MPITKYKVRKPDGTAEDRLVATKKIVFTTGRRCETCLYWDQQALLKLKNFMGEPDHDFAGVGLANGMGLCKFNAPDMKYPRWPMVSKEDWCACWEGLVDVPTQQYVSTGEAQ